MRLLFTLVGLHPRDVSRVEQARAGRAALSHVRTGLQLQLRRTAKL